MPKPPIGRQQFSQPAPVLPTAAPDDFTGGRPIVGASGGFTGAQQLVKYTVERIAPPDGLLGTHHGSFSVDELGMTYGEGLYKISRHEPGKAVAAEFTQKIAQSYGPTRYPNNSGMRNPQPTNRPFTAFGRPPMDRSGQQEEGPAPFRPVYPRPDAGERGLYEFAKNQSAGNNSVLDKAFDMMTNMHEKAMTQIESARQAAPETHFTRFLETQQEIMNSRFEQERNRDLERRATEEAKFDRQRQEERDRWDREQQAAKVAHDRELVRLKAEADAKLMEARATSEERDRRERMDREDRERRATEERKFLLELEDRKMAIVRQESEIQQKRLEAEITRTREEMIALQARTSEESKETREATSKHIEESNKALSEQLERDRESMDREYKLKEKAQDREHELQREMLTLQKENVEKSGGDHIFNTINTVIKEFSKGLEKVVDLKKLEAMTPEAQAAAVARGSLDGNVVAPVEEPRQAAPASKAQPQAASQPASSAPETPSQEAQSVVAGIVENKMETVIRENLRKPFFQEVLKEWALHVDNSQETGVVDATTFANLYLEMMRDPRNDEGRQGCAAFATFMKPRNWKKMYAILKDAVDSEVRESFDRPAAAEFYEQFRAMVIEQIRDYWEQFMAAKNGQKQGGQPVQDTQPQAPVEPQGAPAKSEAQDADKASASSAEPGV
jgi:hypothetical protein